MSKTSQQNRTVVRRAKRTTDNSTYQQASIPSVASSAASFFPADAFREGQREAIERIEAAFNKGYRYVILDAPTGSGKSAIAASFALQSKSCHIITATKILQDQYKRDYEKDMFIMKGRGEYVCILPTDEGKIRSCAKGVCRKKKDVGHSDCPYRTALKIATMSSTTVHNFDSFYYQATFAHVFKPRNLIIFDEAHNLENKSLSFMEFILSNKNHSEMTIPKYSDAKKYNLFLHQQLDTISKRFDQLNNIFEEFGILPDTELDELDELTTLKNKLEMCLSKVDTEYVVDFVEHGTHQSVTFKPLFVGQFVQSALFNYGAKVLMMSATILDKELFCESIGLKEEEVCIVKMKSTFPAKNRPIYRTFAGSMSYKSIDMTLPKVVSVIKKILVKHPNEKGIIHTASWKIDNYIKNSDISFHRNRLTFRGDFRTVFEALAVHAKKDASVLVACGLKEGIDLSGDLSRVQIIVKIPYPSLSDVRVKRRMQLNSKWYGFQTMLAFIQSLGRSVRSKDDYAVTYILDSDFVLFYRINRDLMPQYIKDAFVVED